MDYIYLDGNGLGVLFNKAWKRVAARFIFNEDKKWTSGSLHDEVKKHLSPNTISHASITLFLQLLDKHGLLEKEDHRGTGARGGGTIYKRLVGLDEVWEHQINRTIKAFVNGLGRPLMFHGSWIYPTGASNINPIKEGGR